MYGRSMTGRSRSGFSGFGFRGNSPPYPYIGRGKGGLPRCQYPGLISSYRTMPYSAYQPPAAPEQELDFLKTQARDIRQELEQIESRIRQLEVDKKE